MQLHIIRPGKFGGDAMNTRMLNEKRTLEFNCTFADSLRTSDKFQLDHARACISVAKERIRHRQ